MTIHLCSNPPLIIFTVRTFKIYHTSWHFLLFYSHCFAAIWQNLYGSDVIMHSIRNNWFSFSKQVLSKRKYDFAISHSTCNSWCFCYKTLHFQFNSLSFRHFFVNKEKYQVWIKCQAIKIQKCKKWGQSFWYSESLLLAEKQIRKLKKTKWIKIHFSTYFLVSKASLTGKFLPYCTKALMPLGVRGLYWLNIKGSEVNPKMLWWGVHLGAIWDSDQSLGFELMDWKK